MKITVPVVFVACAVFVIGSCSETVTTLKASAAEPQPVKQESVQKIETIESDLLKVEIDPAFPRVVRYIWKQSGDIIYGQEELLSHVRVNGEVEIPKEIKFSKTADSAEYSIRTHNFGIKLVIKVTGPVLDFRVTEVRDGGYHNLKTFGIPNHSLFCVKSTQSGAQVAAAKVRPTTYTGEEFFAVAEKQADEFPVSRTYVIANTDKLAVTLFNNVLSDSSRIYYQTFEKNGVRQCSISNPDWTYRFIESEIVELPYAKVIITPDRNGDSVVDWQDGAIAYRDIMTSPLGSDAVKKNVVTQIAMNFASLAQNPFLRGLDNIKKIYLYTDGLGQTVQCKGYQSEGHDSAHPDYGNHFNERAGGAKDLNYILDRTGAYNCQVGVHINATEYYPEAKYFSDDLLTGKKGWAWLDESIYTDKRYDIISGKLYHRLDELKAAAAKLSWIYVDVYFGEEWESWKLAHKLHKLDWAVYTEFESVLERDAVWLHRANEYHNLGVQSRIIRFIRNHQQDVWPRHPLLKGSHNLGFMGWHAEKDVNAFIRNVFTNNLPTKYLQHFKIVKWTDSRIDFESGVYAVLEDKNVSIFRDGRKILSGVYNEKDRVTGNNLFFIPWDPAAETKIYHWNDAGGQSDWELPKAWQAVQAVKLYRLSETGRVFVSDIPVKQGKVSIIAEAGVPYVVYPKDAEAAPVIEWGEGSLVKDPGFDSYGFKYWTRSSQASGTADHIAIVNDKFGHSRLKITSADGVVSQKLTDLEGGKTYSASVWVQIDGKRTASLGIKDFGGEDIVSALRKTDVLNCSYCSDKFKTMFQRLRVFFEMPDGKSQATLYLRADRGDADAVVYFDDVRVVEAPERDTKGRWFFEDFEWTDEGWGPFVFAQNDDTHSHLSEAHPPYTNDTINGRFSLKTRSEKKGLVYRTTSGLLRLEPNTTYALSLEYLQDNDGQYSVVAGTDDGKEAGYLLNVKLEGKKGTVSQTFTTDRYDDCFIGVVKNDEKGGVLVIDDVAIDIQRAAK